MKIHPVVAEFVHVDGRMDRQTERHEEANSLFSQFCESAWKGWHRTLGTLCKPRVFNEQ